MLELKKSPAPAKPSAWYMAATEHLMTILTELSQARELDTVTRIVRDAARNLTGADGATFVLRDGDFCHYADESAISPLWKGQRFPINTCVSGWVMLNKKSTVIEDIYKDPRIPADAYRPTFVKSLVMVPIRTENPVGAIGNYWAHTRTPTKDEVDVLQILANFTAIALENLGLYNQLQQKIHALENANEELGRMVWGTAHDLKSPLEAIDYLSSRICEFSWATLPEEGRNDLDNIRRRIRRMEKLLDDTIRYTHVGYNEERIKPEFVDGKTLLENVLALVHIPNDFKIDAATLLRLSHLPRMPSQQILCNLVDNAVRHHNKKNGHIRIAAEEEPGRWCFSVSDDGPGIATQHHKQIFEMFQTLNPQHSQSGSGMGLAYVRKILQRAGQDISVDSSLQHGSSFTFTWPKPADPSAITNDAH